MITSTVHLFCFCPRKRNFFVFLLLNRNNFYEPTTRTTINHTLKKKGQGKEKEMNSKAEDDIQIANTFKKMTQREHIYNLPDSYVGSVEMSTNSMFLFDTERACMTMSDVSYVPALYKICDELIVNAYDQHIRLRGLEFSGKKRPSPVTSIDSRPVTTVQIALDMDTGRFSVENDGDGIHVALHPEFNVYTVELVFSHLLTSTNYDVKGEPVERLTGGKNGLGSKLCNVFAKEFKVTTVDHVRKVKYTQTCRDNMRIIEAPTIRENFQGKPFTRVEMVPDLERFQMQEWSTDMVRVLEKRAYDLSACMPGVRVSFNGMMLPIKNFDQYMSLFPETNDGKVFEVVNDRWEVGAGLSDGFQQVSFVNGLCTIHGGKHVDYVVNMIVKHVSEWIFEKKKVRVKNALIRDNLIVFVKCQIVNPAFDSQTKETLNTPSAKFGSTCKLSDDFFKKLLKMGIVDRVIALYEFKESKTTHKEEKTLAGKGGKLYHILKLEDANEAGGKRSADCTLILTEGDSAKALVVAGVSVLPDADFFGIFPLKGKLLNVRDKSTTLAGRDKVTNNDELKNIKTILGLEKGKKYTSLSELRYGSVMIMTDQDSDGSHIKGLFLNWIDVEWPELLHLGFVTTLITPIVKAKRGKTQEISFYSLQSFHQWQQTEEAAMSGWKTKYYKGLGTSTSDEAREYFKKRKLQKFSHDDVSREQLDMVFNNKRSNDRKNWLLSYDEDIVIDNNVEDLPIKEFVDHELVHFSHYDVMRSLGHAIDGLKPSQRKILFGCFKRRLTEEIKVAQLTGYVGEHAAYHHGEESLNKTIIGMAQNFVGSNNIELLMPEGQFGTRRMGGHDSASPRYIFTRLNPLTSLLFPAEDFPVLTDLMEDDQKIEPEFYVPILPMALVNGVCGVGTGWSTNVPCYHPMQLVDQFIAKIDNPSHEYQELSPFYFGFMGQRVMKGSSMISKGVYQVASYKTVHITELPVGVWSEDYKAFLNSILDHPVVISSSVSDVKAGAAAKGGGDRFLKSYTSKCTDRVVFFELEFDPMLLSTWVNDRSTNTVDVDIFEKKLRLTSTFSLANMHLIDTTKGVRKFDSVVDIMNHFETVRLDFYDRRKRHQLMQLQSEVNTLQQKERFVTGIVRGEIIVYNKNRQMLTQELESLGFARSAESNDYKYLLEMPIDSLTADTVQKLEHKLAQKRQLLDELSTLSPGRMWRNELNAFAEAYQKYASVRMGDLAKDHQFVNSSSSDQQPTSSSSSKKRKARTVKSK